MNFLALKKRNVAKKKLQFAWCNKFQMLVPIGKSIMMKFDKYVEF